MAGKPTVSKSGVVPMRIAAVIGVAALCLSGVVALGASSAGAVPTKGYGTGKAYCTKYAGGVASSLSIGNVWACGGSTTGDTTFDAPGKGVFAWQCVELSARYLWAIDGIWAGPGTGYREGAQLVGQIHHLHPSIAVGVPGPGSVPTAGDVASFGPGGAVDRSVGHTAVVISATPSTGVFETMSENFTTSGGDGAPGLQFWQVRLAGGENGNVQYLGGPRYPKKGAWTKASWLKLGPPPPPSWELRPIANRGGSRGSTAWKVASSGPAGAWVVGTTDSVGAKGAIWRATPASNGWVPFAAPTGPADTQFIDVSASGPSTWVLGTGNYVLEWDGSRWLNRSPSTLQATGFRAAAILGLGTSSAWLVGARGPDPAAARWNGSHWQLIAALTYKGSGFSGFDAVAAVPGAPTELIAGGIRNAQACEGGEPMVQLWTGRSWAYMVVPTPEATLYECNFEPAPALDASWFSIPGTIDGTTGPIIYRHGIGARWMLTSMSAPHASTYWALSGFAESSSASAWAVGQYYLGAPGTGTNYPLIEHWNGSTWAQMTSPRPTSNAWMTGVAVIPGSCQVDAVGNDSHALGATTFPFGAAYC